MIRLWAFCHKCYHEWWGGPNGVEGSCPKCGERHISVATAEPSDEVKEKMKEEQ